MRIPVPEKAQLRLLGIEVLRFVVYSVVCYEQR